MTGKILFYNAEAQTGVISAEDGKRYDFIGAEVMGGESSIVQGGEVDFDLNDEGIPLGICMLQPAPKAQTYENAQTYTAMPQSTASKIDFDELKRGISSFQGCLGIREYWIVIIGAGLAGGLIAYLFGVATMSPFTQVVVGAPFTFISIAAAVKRLHDINQSGKWALLGLVGPLGVFTGSDALIKLNMVVSLLFLVLGFIRSVKQDNRYC